MAWRSDAATVLDQPARSDRDRRHGSGRRQGFTSGGGRIAAGVLLVSALATACGQFASAHRAALATKPAANQAVTPSPNGENTGPAQPGPGYIVVTVVRKVARTPRINTPTLRGPDPLHLCPVQGRGYFSDDFGAPRFAGGFHHHQGNDMFAELGAPVVAPFDGTAVVTPNGLGGNAVTVYGSEGYVYNAHLVSYGRLGPVKAGTVIGYVGRMSTEITLCGMNLIESTATSSPLM